MESGKIPNKNLCDTCAHRDDMTNGLRPTCAHPEIKKFNDSVTDILQCDGYKKIYFEAVIVTIGGKK